MFSSFKNSLGETIGYIDILGPIGRGSMFSDEFSAKQFIDEFRKLEKECSQIVLNISSEGGSVFEGQAIASEIKASKTKTVCKIGALCASIATVISSACDKVIMPENALFMTHAPLSSVDGNAHDLRETADLLDKIEETILNIYEDRCGGKETRAEIKQMIAGDNNDGQGTWMTAQEAYDAGFVDEIGYELAIAAKIDDISNVVINGVKMDLSQYKNLDKVKEMIDKAQPYGNLPLAPRDNQWDAPAADKRVRAFFKCQDKPNAQYKKAFLWYDETKSDLFGSYKLPFADIVDGQLKAIYRGLSAAKGRLNQTDIPSADKTKVEAVLRKYYNKASKEYNDPSISYDNKLEETNMSDKEKKLSLLDAINNIAKTFLGIEDKVEPENSIN